MMQQNHCCAFVNLDKRGSSKTQNSERSLLSVPCVEVIGVVVVDFVVWTGITGDTESS